MRPSPRSVRAMPFVRHELGKRLRIQRIPELHVRLDETAERGTRILQILNELEAGDVVEGDVPVVEALPTPVLRLPHEGDLVDEPPSAAPPVEHRRRKRTYRPKHGDAATKPPKRR